MKQNNLAIAPGFSFNVGKTMRTALIILLCSTALLAGCADPEVHSVSVRPHDNTCIGDTVSVSWDAVGATTLTAMPATRPPFSNTPVNARGSTSTQILGPGDTTFVAIAASNNRTARGEDTVHLLVPGSRALTAVGTCQNGLVVYSVPSLTGVSAQVRLRSIFNHSGYAVNVSHAGAGGTLPPRSAIANPSFAFALDGSPVGPWAIYPIGLNIRCPPPPLPLSEPPEPLPDIPPLTISLDISCPP